MLANAAYACSPYGLIGAKWHALGGANGALGNCVEDEKDDGAGGRIELFKNGWIDWDGKKGEAFAVYGLIGSKWNQLGLARLGIPSQTKKEPPTGSVATVTLQTTAVLNRAYIGLPEEAFAHRIAPPMRFMAQFVWSGRDRGGSEADLVIRSQTKGTQRALELCPGNVIRSLNKETSIGVRTAASSTSCKAARVS